MLDYGNTVNGFYLEWEAASEHLESHPECGGRIELRPLEYIYSEVTGLLQYEDCESAGRERLAAFRIVDKNADEAAVGIYHEQQPDPELYYLFFGDGDLPAPLGVSLAGYVQLLTLSLGYTYWPLLLVELNEHFDQHPDQLFPGPQGANAQEFVADMTALYPAFSLAAFVQLYQQVRLPR